MPRLVYIVCILCCGLVIACGSESELLSSNPDPQSASGATTDEVVGGQVSTLDLSADTGSLNLANVTQGEDVILLLFSQNGDTTALGYNVGSSEGDSFLTIPKYRGLVGDDQDPTDKLHQILRAAEEGITEDILPADKTKYLRKNLSVGSDATFKVLNSLSDSSSYDTVKATLRLQNDDINLYVDKRNAGSLRDADLQKLLDKFSTVIDEERTLFGLESDVNGDGRFSVLFTQSVNELSGSAGGVVTGFFYAVDLHNSSKYTISNEQEIFYTFVPDASGEFGPSITANFSMENIYPGVFVHEFQHMINYNQHHNVYDGGVESGWLNEALSHLVEDIYSLDGNFFMAETGLENPARVANFFTNISNTCFSCGTALRQRGGGYLFLRYLYEQAEVGNLSGAIDGSDLIYRLTNTNKTGIDNVVHAAFGEGGSKGDFKTWLGHFALAIYLSNTGMNGDSRFNFLGINLRSLQEDNRGTELQGPAVIGVESLPITDTISGNGVHYLQIPGEVLMAYGEKLNLSFSQGSSFGGFLIQ